MQAAATATATATKHPCQCTKQHLLLKPKICEVSEPPGGHTLAHCHTNTAGGFCSQTNSPRMRGGHRLHERGLAIMHPLTAPPPAQCQRDSKPRVEAGQHDVDRCRTHVTTWLRRCMSLGVRRSQLVVVRGSPGTSAPKSSAPYGARQWHASCNRWLSQEATTVQLSSCPHLKPPAGCTL